MKRIPLFLVAVALAAASVGHQANPTAPDQFGTAAASQTAYVLKPIPFDAVHHGQAAGPRIRLWESTSGNWSGYAVPLDTSGVSDTFSAVRGTWTVPAVTGTGKTTTYSSAWVGLDGYDNGTVEQIGTEQDSTKRGAQYYAWFEMYPSASYMIQGFPAAPGDSITAQVQYAGQTTVQLGRKKTAVESVFHLTITNATKHVSYNVPTAYTTVVTAARASAEWVMEAPSTSQILPLANFGTIAFFNCEAASVGTGGALAPISSWAFDPMTMADPNGGAAVPSALSTDGTAFSVTWAAK